MNRDELQSAVGQIEQRSMLVDYYENRAQVRDDHLFLCAAVRAASARTSAAEARNKELEQERDEARKLEQRFRTAYNSATDRADSLSLLLRKVGETTVELRDEAEGLLKTMYASKVEHFPQESRLQGAVNKASALLTRLSSDTEATRLSSQSETKEQQ